MLSLFLYQIQVSIPFFHACTKFKSKYKFFNVQTFSHGALDPITSHRSHVRRHLNSDTRQLNHLPDPSRLVSLG